MFPLINALITVWTCQSLLDEKTTNNFQHDLDIISICIFPRKLPLAQMRAQSKSSKSVNPSTTPLDHP